MCSGRRASGCRRRAAAAASGSRRRRARPRPSSPRPRRGRSSGSPWDRPRRCARASASARAGRRRRARGRSQRWSIVSPLARASASSRAASEYGLLPPCAVCPPSTTISAPLMNDDSSEIRKTTSGATSSTVPVRPSGVCVDVRSAEPSGRRGGHRRLDEARQDRVDADALRAELEARHAREPADAPLADAVGDAA